MGWDLRYCHTDNVRTERYPHCQMEYPYVRMLPVETTQLGRGEDQAFTDRCDRGYKVRCPDDKAFTGVPLPEVLYSGPASLSEVQLLQELPDPAIAIATGDKAPFPQCRRGDGSVRTKGTGDGQFLWRNAHFDGFTDAVVTMIDSVDRESPAHETLTVERK